jgi:DnaJ like chaperone protein
MMKQEPSADVESLVVQAMQRIPGLEAPAVIGLMAEVAKVDGQIHSREVDVIRETALAFGLPAYQWDSVAEELGLISDLDRLEQYYAILGLSVGASIREIKIAYRTRIRDYHPDKVATLAPDFQEFAHQKSRQIIEAYEVLCRKVG